MALQVGLAALLLKVSVARAAFASLNEAMLALEAATRAGTSMVFGFLGGAPLPYAETAAGASFVLAFRALPVVLVMSALSALLFHWRVLPLLVRAMSALLEKALGVGGAVGLSTAANVFVGMVEAPLLVKPYLARVSRGELFIILSAGMAGVAGTVMALYAGILAQRIPGALGHILAASFISAPAAIVFAALMVPPEGPPTGSDARLPRTDASSVDAVTRGTSEGLALLLNIVAMLIVLVALVALANQLLALFPHSGAPWSLQGLLGWAMAPLHGWPGALGPGGHRRRTARHQDRLNELIAYLDLGPCRPMHSHRAAHHHDLRPMRLRQSRQPRHHDRRHRDHAAGASKRDPRTRAAHTGPLARWPPCLAAAWSAC